MFDISIGRLSGLWSFSGASSVPSGTDIAAALETVDYRRVIVAGDSVQMGDSGAWLDFGGIAKGYIADRMADLLRERGVPGAVIDLGGDVVIVGEKQDGSPWRIGVRRPFGSPGELLGVVETREAAVITSGVYERNFEQGGVLYHHILDPSTGMPVQSDIVGVTVLAESAMVGDALSTAMLLLGSERAVVLALQVPEFIGALLILESGELMEIGDIDFQLLP